MIGLFLLICIYCVLGFFFTWIANAVAKEDFGIGKGVLILVLTGIIAAVGKAVLLPTMPEAAQLLLPVVIDFCVLTLLTWFICNTGWKESAIIAVVYSVFIFLVMLGLRAMLG